nr:hypothetical protein [Candidatus Sigynarchaeum springense]
MPRYRTGRLTPAEKSKRNAAFALILIMLISLVIGLVMMMQAMNKS